MDDDDMIINVDEVKDLIAVRRLTDDDDDYVDQDGGGNDDDAAAVKDPSIVQTNRSLCSLTTSWGLTLTTMSLSQLTWLIY